MKLLYFSPRPFGMMGTPGTYHLTESLAKLTEVLVIADDISDKKFEIVHAPSSKLNLQNISIGKKGYLDQIQKIIKDFQPDIVVMANYARWFEVANAVKAVNPKIKIVLDIKSPLITGTQPLLNDDHPIQINGKKYSYLLDLVLSRCDEDIHSWLPDTKITKNLYPLGIKLDQFKENLRYESSESIKKIVFIGSYSQNRKLDDLLKLIYQLPQSIKSRFKFDFYGSGPYKDQLEAQLTDLKLDSIVHIYDALPQEQLFERLSEYDIGLGWVPSDIFDAAPSLKALEYIAAGLIPLLTSTKGHVRNVTEGFHAILFNETPNSFQVALEQILDDNFTSKFREENLKRIQDRDWDVVAKNYIFPSLQKLQTSMSLPERKVENDKKVQEESHWIPSVNVFQSSSLPNNITKVLCATSERLYYGLKEEIGYIPLMESNWESQINDEFDFILLESCPETTWGEWHYAYCGQVQEHVKNLILNANKINLPIVLWITVDFDYRDQYKEIAKLVDVVAFADPRYKEWLKTNHIQETLELWPAIQPKLFNPLIKINSGLLEKDSQQHVLFQGASLAENSTSFQEKIKHSSLYFMGFERTLVPTRNQLDKQNQISSNFTSKGKVSYRLLPEVLKRAQAILIADNDNITHTELVWQILENHACRCKSFVNSIADYQHPILKQLNDLSPIFSEQSLTDMEKVQNPQEKLYQDSSSTEVWRYIMDNHTYLNRIEKLLSKLQISNNTQEAVKISVVSPTKRPEQLSQILENYHKQTYPNKELIIIVNSDYEDYKILSEKIASLNEVKVLHMPIDKKAASALNFANQYSQGDFIFRFDDDDYYGPEYLSDAIRFLKIENADIIGKFGAFMKIEEMNKVFYRKNATEDKQLILLNAKDLTLPQAAISGATFGVSKMLINQLSFPEESLRTADSAWLEKIREYAPNTIILKTDPFQFTIGRKQNQSGHTWSVDLNRILDMKFDVTSKFTEVPR